MITLSRLTIDIGGQTFEAKDVTFTLAANQQQSPPQPPHQVINKQRKLKPRRTSMTNGTVASCEAISGYYDTDRDLCKGDDNHAYRFYSLLRFAAFCCDNKIEFNFSRTHGFVSIVDGDKKVSYNPYHKKVVYINGNKYQRLRSVDLRGTIDMAISLFNVKNADTQSYLSMTDKEALSRFPQ